MFSFSAGLSTARGSGAAPHSVTAISHVCNAAVLRAKVTDLISRRRVGRADSVCAQCRCRAVSHLPALDYGPPHPSGPSGTLGSSLWFCQFDLFVNELNSKDC